MKRKDFYQILRPLPETLYPMAYSLVPDDLQAEQLIIDSVNAYLLKEKKWILNQPVNLSHNKEVQILRKAVLKNLLRYVVDIGARRSFQLSEQMKLVRPAEYASFYSLDPKIRAALRLRYEYQFSVEEIEEMMEMPRHEVIEKLHNGRFLLLNDLNAEAGA